ncbi:MAG: 50S ribosomal protein L29 [Okeania sp. SIO3C4]|nr:50S ribosomal protein L29 [Okeania sp. SIO3B3]NER08099.1 50S ribosomal protein L29 [Okeania sp. SIO3C4]
MPFPKVEEVRNLSDEELVAEIVKVKRELFDLRMLKATGRLEKPHLFKHNRHRLAQLLTIERERELVKEAEASTQEVAESASNASATTTVETADNPA